ncbi:MAG: NAD(P)-dependent oxidoreductase [Patescibacteria group bacterium]
MKRITLAGDFPFTDEQRARLDSLGAVRNVSFSSSEEWLAAVQGSDIILSDGDYLFENLEKLEDVFVTYPYIEIGAFDTEKLKRRGVFVANTSGSNRDAIVEWVMFVVLSLFRKFPDYLNTNETKPFALHNSLVGKKVLIVGKGSIGTCIGDMCKAFKMDVDFYTREDNLYEKSVEADLVINALNCNSSSKNLLDEKFFMSLKEGSYFVTFARPYTYDIDDLLKSIDAGIVAGAGIDCDPEEPFDTQNAFYQKCLNHPKVLVTPHVAFSAKEASAQGREVAIQNIEAYLIGEPQNILTKK